MKVNDQIRDEKLQYDVNREASKISTHHEWITSSSMNILLVKKS